MVKSRSISICTLIVCLAFALFSCAGGPAQPKSTVASASPPAKVAKTRTIVTKVSVLVKETTFYSDGLVDGYTVYKLDGDKKAVVEKDKFDAARSEPVERSVFEYKGGREIAESIYESDGKLRSRRELGYDSAGRLSSDRLVDAKGVVLSASAYSYDASGRKTEWRALDGSGAVKATTGYSYGPDGLVAVEMRDAAGTVTGTIKSEYEGGRLARRVYTGASGEAQKSEVYVNSGARPASMELRRSDGSLVAKTAYEYGSSGELAKATEFLPSGAASSYTTYEYVVREDSSTETYYE
jgi:antitoxin component YwqK of YwqJK toxin-antitoxin module